MIRENWYRYILHAESSFLNRQHSHLTAAVRLSNPKIGIKVSSLHRHHSDPRRYIPLNRPWNWFFQSNWICTKISLSITQRGTVKTSLGSVVLWEARGWCETESVCGSDFHSNRFWISKSINTISKVSCMETPQRLWIHIRQGYCPADRQTRLKYPNERRLEHPESPFWWAYSSRKHPPLANGYTKPRPFNTWSGCVFNWTKFFRCKFPRYSWETDCKAWMTGFSVHDFPFFSLLFARYQGLCWV
jgi:hypothetical protein